MFSKYRLALNQSNGFSVSTAPNVALRKPATQTDTASGAGPDLAVDGDSSTCAATASAAAEWTLDMMDYFIIDEVSIHVGMPVLLFAWLI